MAIAAVITAILVVCGVCGMDIPVFMMLRKIDCKLWAVIDAVFAAKVWIGAAFVAVLVFCVKKYIKAGITYKNAKNKFSAMVVLRDFYLKTKTSNAMLIFCSVLSAGIVVKILKIFIGRARPVFYEALGMTGFFPPSMDWAFNSMPSGHTAVSFAGLVMIGMLAPKYKPLTWTMAIIIGVSRIAIGAHWPSDVIFGAFVGMVMADIVKGTLLKK